MQLALSDGRIVELGYCYNVLPGESVAALIDQLRRICGPVRARLGVARLGIGLWIARPAASELADPAARRAHGAAANGGLPTEKQIATAAKSLLAAISDAAPDRAREALSRPWHLYC